MPVHEFFRQFGLFTLPGFLSVEECAHWRSVAESREGRAAEVYKAGGQRTDEEKRKTLEVLLREDSENQLIKKIEALRPDLERHFELILGPMQSLRCLIYGPGDFFELHSDSIPVETEEFKHIQRRQISVVVFLNTSNQARDAYEGGELTFHGLMNFEGSGAFGFPLEPETGLLVGFRSTILHEVAPVKRGKRYTLVTWYT